MELKNRIITTTNIIKTIVNAYDFFLTLRFILTLQFGQSIVGAFVLNETPCSICSLQSGTPHFEQLAMDGFPHISHFDSISQTYKEQ
ncbi:MAG: hypothetical protein ACTSQW_03580 [Promethearchaeota archaeon]|jgi:hypothetical protein